MRHLIEFESLLTQLLLVLMCASRNAKWTKNSAVSSCLRAMRSSPVKALAIEERACGGLCRCISTMHGTLREAECKWSDEST